MKKSIFLIPLFLFADVDPFAAGLNSPNPYGLTSDEKFILKNQKDIATLKKRVDSITGDISTIKLKMLHYDDIIDNNAFLKFYSANKGHPILLENTENGKITMGIIRKN